MKIKIITWAIIALSITPFAFAKMTVSVISAPSTPGDRFTATVVGAPGINEVNPCYQNTSCSLKFYTISESWLPGGVAGYGTVDSDNWTAKYPIHTYPTLGEWWKDVTNKSRTGRDYLPIAHGTDACVVVAAYGISGMAPNSIVSNCARGIVQARDCRITEPTLTLDFGTVTTGTRERIANTSMSVNCDGNQPYDVIIQTNTDELIPLGGSGSLKAQLDWGQGYGKLGKYRITGSQRITVSGKLLGIDTAAPGSWAGSAVVNISYP